MVADYAFLHFAAVAQDILHLERFHPSSENHHLCILAVEKQQIAVGL